MPGGPVIGNVYRADIEQYMEGIEVLSVMAPKTASPLDPKQRASLNCIPETKKGPDVVVTYAAKGRGPRRDGDSRDGGSASRYEAPDLAARAQGRWYQRRTAATGASKRPKRVICATRATESRSAQREADRKVAPVPSAPREDRGVTVLAAPIARRAASDRAAHNSLR